MFRGFSLFPASEFIPTLVSAPPNTSSGRKGPATICTSELEDGVRMPDVEEAVKMFEESGLSSWGVDMFMTLLLGGCFCAWDTAAAKGMFGDTSGVVKSPLDGWMCRCCEAAEPRLISWLNTDDVVLTDRAELNIMLGLNEEWAGEVELTPLTQFSSMISCTLSSSSSLGDCFKLI